MSRTGRGLNKIACFAAVLACALAVAGSALAVDFVVYRAIDGKTAGGCLTGAMKSPSQFRIDPDGLSTFQGGFPLLATKPFALAFHIQNAPHDPPHDGDQGTVAGVNGHDYTATYTPVHGDGHWSLIRAGRTADEMKADYSAYANAGGNIVRNPNYNGVTPYCP